MMRRRTMSAKHVGAGALSSGPLRRARTCDMRHDANRPHMVRVWLQGLNGNGGG